MKPETARAAEMWKMLGVLRETWHEADDLRLLASAVAGETATGESRCGASGSSGAELFASPGKRARDREFLRVEEELARLIRVAERAMFGLGLATKSYIALSPST